MEVAKDKENTFDTLEVLLNPGLIKTKACTLAQNVMGITLSQVRA